MNNLWALMLLVVTSSLLVAPSVYSQNSVQQDALLQIELTPVAYSQGKFQQQRWLPGLPKALVSSGEFYFDEHQGFLWYTQTPMTQLQFFGSEAVYNYTLEDNTIKAEKLRSAANRHISKIIHSLINGDWQQLQRIFTAQVVINELTQVTLTPSNKKLQKHLQSLSFEIDEHLRSYRIALQNGELLEVHFSKVEENGTSLFENCDTPDTTLKKVCRHILSKQLASP